MTAGRRRMRGLDGLRWAVAVLLAGVLALVGFAQSARAATHTVTNTNDSGAGSLRQMILDASSGDTITFDASLAGSTITLASELQINKDLSIDGSGLEPPISLSGGDATRIFSIDTGYSIEIADILIEHGYAVSSGGGGIYNQSALTLTRVSFVSNDADLNGGGVYNTAWGTLTVENCSFTGNSGYGGGAIQNDGALTAVDSVFDSNTVDNTGGAIANMGSGVSTISSSTFTGNSAFMGGALYHNASSLNLANSTFWNNTATSGGGINIYAGAATLSNNTLSENGATFGGNLRNGSDSLDLLNNLLADSSSGGDCYNEGTLVTNTNNLIEDDTCSPAYSGDPGLNPLADNGGPTQTMAISPGSAAFDAGDDATCEATDQRGISRPQGEQCDIGAYELATIVNSLNDPGDGTCDESECTLREAIALAGGGGTVTFDESLAGGVIALTSQLTIDKALTVDGTSLSSPIEISGGDTVRVFVITGTGDATLDGLVIRDGQSPGGGGIRNNGILAVSNSTFTGNQGSIYNDVATLSITRSTFTSNDGGIYNNAGSLTVSNSTFAGNNTFPGAQGAGVMNAGGTATVSGSTFSGNNAPSGGGGIANTGTLHLLNSILAGSVSGGDCYNTGTLSTNTSNLIEDGTCSPAVTGDPLLRLLADNGGLTQTMALAPGSPAFDAGDDGTCEDADQRGMARPQGDHCDIGAYESEFIYPIFLPLILR